MNFSQRDFRRRNSSSSTASFSRIAGSTPPRDAAATKERCGAIGERYGKSAYQVALRFLTQIGASYTVEAKSAAHFGEDLDIFGFELTAEEMASLQELNQQPAFEGSVTGPTA